MKVEDGFGGRFSVVEARCGGGLGKIEEELVVVIVWGRWGGSSEDGMVATMV